MHDLLKVYEKGVSAQFNGELNKLFRSSKQEYTTKNIKERNQLLENNI